MDEAEKAEPAKPGKRPLSKKEEELRDRTLALVALYGRQLREKISRMHEAYDAVSKEQEEFPLMKRTHQNIIEGEKQSAVDALALAKEKFQDLFEEIEKLI